jgi:hypothetical protein
MQGARGNAGGEPSLILRFFPATPFLSQVHQQPYGARTSENRSSLTLLQTR